MHAYSCIIDYSILCRTSAIFKEWSEAQCGEWFWPMKWFPITTDNRRHNKTMNWNPWAPRNKRPSTSHVRSHHLCVCVSVCHSHLQRWCSHSHRQRNQLMDGVSQRTCRSSLSIRVSVCYTHYACKCVLPKGKQNKYDFSYKWVEVFSSPSQNYLLMCDFALFINHYLLCRLMIDRFA